MLNRWIFDVELSFDKMKFFVIVKRRMSIKPVSDIMTAKDFNKDMKRELKSIRTKQ